MSACTQRVKFSQKILNWIADFLVLTRKEGPSSRTSIIIIRSKSPPCLNQTFTVLTPPHIFSSRFCIFLIQLCHTTHNTQNKKQLFFLIVLSFFPFITPTFSPCQRYSSLKIFFSFSLSFFRGPLFHRFCSGVLASRPLCKKMTVVENHTMDDLRDQFPIGMRVLAVDDDSTCLMVLETLLRRCQYHGNLLQLLPYVF